MFKILLKMCKDIIFEANITFCKRYVFDLSFLKRTGIKKTVKIIMYLRDVVDFFSEWLYIYIVDKILYVILYCQALLF